MRKNFKISILISVVTLLYCVAGYGQQGTEPLPILNCGMSCQFNAAEVVPLNELDPASVNIIIIDFKSR